MMASCNYCGKEINDAATFCPYCGSQVNYYQEKSTLSSQPLIIQTVASTPNTKPRPSSNIALAILSTICCCLPLGIVAIIYANKVDKLYIEGRYDDAVVASEKAQLWSVIGIIIGIIFPIVYLIFCFVLAVN